MKIGNYCNSVVIRARDVRGLTGFKVKEVRGAKVKVKYTIVQALRLCTGRTVHRGSRGITLVFLGHGTRRGEESASRPGCSLPSGKTRYPLYRKLGGPQVRYGQVRKISPPTGIRSPDRPAPSQSLYRLRYPAHKFGNIFLFIYGVRAMVRDFIRRHLVRRNTVRYQTVPCRIGGG